MAHIGCISRNKIHFTDQTVLHPGISERTVLLATTLASALVSCGGVLVEVVAKEVEGGGHVGNALAFLYLGAEPEDLHPSAWFLWTALGHISAYITALILYRVIKAR